MYSNMLAIVNVKVNVNVNVNVDVNENVNIKSINAIEIIYSNAEVFKLFFAY